MPRLLISETNTGPNLCQQNRIVSSLTSTPHSSNRYSTFLTEVGNHKQGITVWRMISGLVFKLRKGLGLVIPND